ncbi:MBL fold metallo-hydrolase [Streptacidiphilus pinicola]|uniref:MBL fold metallo-hydrolase n=1 Tax=Streptacidiphilus pinicola TaxID=2219663 RepID=A0A2X0KCY2_9ACTN|nr:MBL fold metallo-hydrolase [Streptacidiphilus pinicola]RAG84830.1 MBL fold metallo-hydrolase [Streptacidiphilus pinicola]
MSADRTEQATAGTIPAARVPHPPVRGELRPVADGVHVWRPQPSVGWGLANCGLLTSRSSAAWIDTPYDRALADQFLALSRPLLAPGTDIDWLLVTHGNGDHLWGWEAVPDARVVYTAATATHIAHEPDPCDLHRLVHDGDPGTLVGWYLNRHFGRYRWAETRLPQPALTFSGEVEIAVGDIPVQLTQLPPAHTTGDLLAYLPRQRVCFSGDIVFAATDDEPGDHPVHWAGPLENVIDGCDRVLATGATVVVPGHGPVLGREGVLAHRDYLCHLRDHVHDLHGAGLTAQDAARRIAAENHHPALHLRERLSITVALQYRHLDASPPRPMLEQMHALAQLAWELEHPGVPTP